MKSGSLFVLFEARVVWDGEGGETCTYAEI